MIHYQILYWRDIPAQVKIYSSKRRPTSHALSSRFQPLTALLWKKD